MAYPISLQILHALFGFPGDFDIRKRDFISYLQAKNLNFKKLSRKQLSDKLWNLKQSKLLKTRIYQDGSASLTLTNKGKEKILHYRLNTIKIPKHTWDGKWRLLFFDIPEKQRELRDYFRKIIQNINFIEMQKSVFVTPFECGNELEFITEKLGIAPYTRYAVVEFLEDDERLRKYFKL